MHIIHIPAHVGDVPVHIPLTQVSVASPLARPNPLSHVYVAVEPSKVPPGVATVASLAAGGDPQSAKERNHLHFSIMNIQRQLHIGNQ